MKKIAKNINWDTDGVVVSELPETVEIPEDVHEDNVADWLSDTYGYCVFGYNLVQENTDEYMRYQANKVIESIPENLRDWVYRQLWAEHVREDVESQVEQLPYYEDITDEEYETLVGNVVERYVYQGDYDCNMSYWNNIDALIEEVR